MIEKMSKKTGLREMTEPTLVEIRKAIKRVKSETKLETNLLTRLEIRMARHECPRCKIHLALDASGYFEHFCDRGKDGNGFNYTIDLEKRLEERERIKKELLEKIDARIKNIQKSAGEHGEEELSESLALINELTSLRAEIEKL